MPKPNPVSATRTAGRPAKLNQERILDTAMLILSEGHGQDVSIRQLAQRLQTVPGNLYTYFPHKEALLDALAERALSSLDIALDTSLAWHEQVAQWMESFHQALKARPELMFLMGLAGTSPSTLRKIWRIAQLLQDAGLEAADAVHHAQGLLWTVMSYTFFELQASDPKVVKQLQQAGMHDEYPEVLQHLAVANLDPLWQATLTRNIDGIRLQVSKVTQ